jgi:ferredoxin-thioredoxin reductase catalytic chain
VINVDKLYEMLKKAQELKGYFFNRDKDAVFDLLGGLIRNSERYGYMSCPCRLATGDYGKDRDIICPCVYRAPDVKEFGSCYCGLYVSEDWNEGRILNTYVPERRPAPGARSGQHDSAA